MQTIYKYEIEERDVVVLQLPEHASILKVARQGDKIYAWVGGNIKNKIVPQTLRIFGTGHPIPTDERLLYLDTVIMSQFVWHIFLKNGV